LQGIYIEMISIEQVKSMIETALPDAKVQVDSEDLHHFEAVVVSSTFSGQRPVRRQQMVYAALNELLTSGRLHALALKTFTPEEYTGTI
jgi:acid stress-induced BolA-like protein IbaG/YrbA